MAGEWEFDAQHLLADAGVVDLPDSWDVVELGELMSDDRGISVGVMYPGEHTPNGVPLIKAGDLNGNVINPHPEFRISREKHREYCRTELGGGELVMTLVGNIGQCAVVPSSMAGWNTARAVAVIRLKDPSDACFVRLCLLSRPIQHLMDVWCNTTVQATLNLKDIRRLPLPWPQKASRDKIASFGKAFDDKIELNRRMNETLEAMARALFTSWFVDFDPVKAKAAGRQPAGMDAATAAFFPDSFQDSTLGPIPKGWEVGTLGHVTENPRRGVQPDKLAPGTPYIGLEHMPRRCIALSEWGTAAQLESNKFEFHKGEILFGKLRPYFHKVGVAPVEGVCSTDILVVRPKAPEWSGFVLGHAMSDAFVSHTTAASDGTKMPRTNWSDMARYAIVLPSAPVVHAFSAEIGVWVERIVASIHESRALAAVRDVLLPKLLTGELPACKAQGPANA